MSIQDRPGTTRRRFLGTTAAGLAAASVSGLGAPRSPAQEPTTPATGLADAVVEAFKTYRLVGLGEIHDLQTHGDALSLLLSDPRLPGVVDDIVLEFGNALYQDTIDAFTAGHPVADADLRRVWRDTTQSPYETWDEPMYEQVYRTVRAANWVLPPTQRMRVLLGDGPIDWARITTRADWLSWERRHRQHGGHGPSFWVPLIEKEVLAKGRRALLNFGLDTFTGANPTVAGEPIYRIVDLVPPPGDPGRLAERLSPYARYSVIPADTWLGAADAGLFFDAPGVPGPGLGDTSPHPRGKNGRRPVQSIGENYSGQRIGSLIDAGLYLGQPTEVTASWPNPAVYLDPVYWKELERRNALSYGLNLNWWRQEHPEADVNWWRPRRHGKL